MILKINGIPIETVREKAEYLQESLIDMYQFVHTPLNLDLGMNGHHLFTTDINVLNFNHHLFEIVKPHVKTAFDYIF